ncbi:MAG TPA: ABC transporter permease [Tepidisphaeraceae bacterium]|jgi:lipopolysaccharide transport system permease protein
MTLSSAPAAVAPSVASEPQYVETVIRPRRGWIGVDWAELIKHRELLFFLIWRDVKVKYKQAVFGSAWAIVVPLVSVIIYSVVGHFAGFSKQKIAGMESVPYPVYIYAALLPWLFLQGAINGGGMSLVNNQPLLSKIYLPRLFIPTANIGSALVDMFFSSLIFGLMIVFYVIKTGGAFTPSWNVVYLPLLFVLLLVAALGTAYFLSALTVMFRDLRFIIPFITQLGIWLTAVVYPQTIFIQGGRDFRPWLALNPFAGIVQSFRWAITGEPLQVMQLISSIVMCSVLLIVGLFYFKRVERRFADIA